MEIAWFGGFNEVQAFPTVNRELSKAMERRGHTIYRNQHFNNQGELIPTLLIFQYEYLFDIQPRHPLTVGMMTWEFGGEDSVPLGWREGSKKWDLTISISDWVTRVFSLNKIHPLTTVRMGINPDEFYPVDTQHEPYTFLWAGGSDKRHGWDLAIEGFRAAFPDNNDVRLLLKVDTNYPSIKSYVDNIGDPRISYQQTNIKSMRDFYELGDCLLFPVRGAGPGLIGLEAMACGLPVIVTNCGGPKEYSKYAYHVDYDIAETKHHCKTDSPHPFWVEPKLDSLVSKIKQVYLNQDGARIMGAKASEYARTFWTWDRSAAMLEYVLEQAAKPIKVSMVILTYDRRGGSTISRCIENIKKFTTAPTDPGFEIVIVDNNSANWETAVDIAARHPHNRVVRLNKNLGVSGGRNAGIKNSVGEYILFFDDDAFPTKPDWLPKLLSYFNNPEVGIVGQTGTYIKNDSWGVFWESTGVTEADIVQGYCQLFPRKIVDEIGFIDEKFGKFWHEDADWCLRIREAGYKVIDADNVGVWHMGSCSGDDGSYGQKMNYLKSKWADKPEIRVKQEDWHKPWTG